MASDRDSDLVRGIAESGSRRKDDAGASAGAKDESIGTVVCGREGIVLIESANSDLDAKLVLVASPSIGKRNTEKSVAFRWLEMGIFPRVGGQTGENQLFERENFSK